VDIANPRTFVSGRAVDILGIFDNRTGGAIIPLKGKQRLSEFPKQAASLSAWKSAMFFAYSHPLEGGETSVVKRDGPRDLGATILGISGRACSQWQDFGNHPPLMKTQLLP
jgi:hypothetical protein